MILLDTNIVSEVYKPRPDALVVNWIDAQPRDLLYLCTPVLAEMYFGIELLDEGDRKNRLRASIERLQNELYRDRILVFDVLSAIEYGQIAASRRKSGQRINQVDGLIAAIARANGATLATRNSRHFVDLGLNVIDPFDVKS